MASIPNNTTQAPLQIILAQVLLQTDDKPTQSTAADPASQAQDKAILVAGGRVLAVGNAAEMQALAPKAELLDYRDLLLTAGLCDAHIHLVMYGASLHAIDLASTRSVAEVQNKLATRVAKTASGEWIQGGGFLSSQLGLNDYPTAQQLDEVSPNHPVVFYSRDRHMIWANSLALQLAGVHADTPDPAGGHIVRPLGCLQETAQELVQRVIPAPSAEEWLAFAKAGAADLATRGFVSAHTMAFEEPEAPRALQILAQRDELPLRIWACLPHQKLEQAHSLGLAASSNSMFEWGGVKFFADGALGSRTAWLHGAGFADGSGTGIALDSPELIYQRSLEALELGLIPTTHAIGDRANSEVIAVYERLQPIAQAKGLRLRIEHSQHLQVADIPRMRPFTSSVQPLHLLADAPNIRHLLPHLQDTSYAFASLWQAGANLALGSDAPVTPPDIQANFAAATTRLDNDGQALAPAEALTPQQVLWAHTRGPALAVGWTDEGIIQPAARAAFTLWDNLGGNARALVL